MNLFQLVLNVCPAGVSPKRRHAIAMRGSPEAADMSRLEEVFAWVAELQDAAGAGTNSGYGTHCWIFGS